MRRRALYLTGALVVIVLLGVVALSARGSPAEARARALFRIPRGSPVDTASLRAGFLRLVPLGRTVAEVRTALERAGIGADSLSGYAGPDSSGVAVVRVEYDPRVLAIVQRSYALLLHFDATDTLRAVEARVWLTGP